jgi:Na+-translocating ferredoxin:NAD+ oxidoreductase RnfG subunit
MEFFRRQARKLSAVLLAVFTGVAGIAPSAQAGMIGTQQVIADQAAAEQRAELRAMLQRDDVREQLTAWGVEPQVAEARIDSMTAEEVAQLSAKMDEMPAGSGVVGAIVFVFVLLLITDILGLTDVYPFVR